MQKFEYLMPTTIDEAISLCVSHGERAKFIAGGTDVMIKIKEGKIGPKYLVSLRRVQGLDHITYKDGELRIGSLVTHRMLELSFVDRQAWEAAVAEPLGAALHRQVEIGRAHV